MDYFLRHPVNATRTHYRRVHTTSGAAPLIYERNELLTPNAFIC